jgi:prepilin-type N-terminal cleavage/methylation domain-containing protein
LQPSNNDRGFTIIEVLIAIVILTVALVSMAELMAVTLRLQMLGRNQTSAVRLAQDKLDELMSQNFAVPALSVGGSLTADQANHFDTPPNDPNFRRRWVVAAGPVDDLALAGKLRIITVRVIPIVTDTRTFTPTDLTTMFRCWPCL